MTSQSFREDTNRRSRRRVAAPDGGAVATGRLAPRRRPGAAVRLAALAAMAFAAPALAESPPSRAQAVGQVTFSQIQIALFYSGSVGGGVLSFDGKEHPFTLGGLGVGGIGASRVEATGEVYGLSQASDFEGAYVQARYGAAAGSDDIGGLWLRNANGVELRLESRREGYALSLGGDAVYVRFD
jgi:hypothetical protein